MDPVSGSAVRHPPGGPSSTPAPSCANSCSALLKCDLLERLRVCAALDRRFCKAWFDELDMERCSNFSNVVGVSNDLCISSEWSEGVNAHANGWYESTEAAFQRISFELQDLEDREKRLTDHVDTLNRQYEGLMAELTDSVHHRAVLPNSQLSETQGVRRIPLIASIISAKEQEQKTHLYNLRHWNLNLSGVNIPGLPGLLHEVQPNDDA
ncbi:hypothetical protein, conserved [Eimeria brunetti]|uniref:Uncharacterized protein n=1 Tax=Eimeria brunetti TaxID=51314 RepID=U6L749_9EIME|nr:hypothetical protein, conserved [Eimeria brunetti]